MATTMSAPARSCLIWRSYGVPPYTVTSLSCVANASGSSERRTWVASSRVGTMMRARGCLGRLCSPARRARIGRPKASVLPEPVWARPSTSEPFIASGMTAAWTGVGVVISTRPRAMMTLPESPSWAKDGRVVAAEDKGDPQGGGHVPAPNPRRGPASLRDAVRARSLVLREFRAPTPGHKIKADERPWLLTILPAPLGPPDHLDETSTTPTRRLWLPRPPLTRRLWLAGGTRPQPRAPGQRGACNHSRRVSGRRAGSTETGVAVGGDPDRDAPVLLVQVAGGALAAVGVAGGGAGRDVQHPVADGGVDHHHPGQVGAAALALA